MSDGLRASWGDDSTARARLSSMAQTSLSQRDANAVLVVNQNAAGVVRLALLKHFGVFRERVIILSCRQNRPGAENMWDRLQGRNPRFSATLGHSWGSRAQ